MKMSAFFRLSALVLAFAVIPATALPQFDDGSRNNNRQSEAIAPAPLTAELKEEIVEGIKDTLLNRAFVPGLSFSNFDELVEKHKSRFEEASTENGFVTAVNRALREYGISHVGLRTPTSAQRRRAAQADLGLFAETRPLFDLLQNPPQRQDPPQTETETPVYTRWHVENEVAVLRLNSFSRGYNQAEMLRQYKEIQNAKTIVVDLRNNGGGAVANLGHLLGLFIPSDKPVGTFINRRTHQAFVASNRNESEADIFRIADWTTSKFRPRAPRDTSIKPFTGKVAVLINRGSASASEIFAAGLRDVADAKLVGAPTRGAVLASVYGRLPGGYELQYPVSDYVTIKGTRLEGNPVAPDIEASGRVTPENDPILEAALKALEEN